MNEIASNTVIFKKINSSSSTGELCSQPVRGYVHQTGRMFPEHVVRSFLDPEYVQQILRTIFMQQKFAQLRTNYIRWILPTIQLYSLNTPNYVHEQMFTLLRTGLTLHYHHQNDFCIKMGSDESPFNIWLIVRDKVTRQWQKTTTFEEKESKSWVKQFLRPF